MSDKSSLEELLDKYKDGTISAAEQHALDGWLLGGSMPDLDLEPIELLSDLHSIRSGLQAQGLLVSKVAGLATAVPKRKVNRWTRLYPMVAAALLLFVLGISLYQWQQDKQRVEDVEALANLTGVVEGEEKAVLVLSNGQKIYIEELALGEQQLANGGSLSKESAGLINFQSLRSNLGAMPREPQYHTLIVPKRSKLGIQLPDGSKVWLNAGSTLRFPEYFGAGERLVELDGEAYFEVVQRPDASHNPKGLVPFIVQTAVQRIAVLGTKFNVSAYKDDDLTLSTLLEGSIEVSALATGKKNILRPNQQSAVSKTGKLNVYPIAASEANAWMSGAFLFSNENLGTILKRISRWYDVEVVLSADLDPQQIHFNGSVEKLTRLRDLLDLLELTKSVKFELKDNKLYVQKQIQGGLNP